MTFIRQLRQPRVILSVAHCYLFVIPRSFWRGIQRLHRWELKALDPGQKHAGMTEAWV